jgi:hypothetical protein
VRAAGLGDSGFLSAADGEEQASLLFSLFLFLPFQAAKIEHRLLWGLGNLRLYEDRQKYVR